MVVMPLTWDVAVDIVQYVRFVAKRDGGPEGPPLYFSQMGERYAVTGSSTCANALPVRAACACLWKA